MSSPANRVARAARGSQGVTCPQRLVLSGGGWLGARSVLLGRRGLTPPRASWQVQRQRDPGQGGGPAGWLQRRGPPPLPGRGAAVAAVPAVGAPGHGPFSRVAGGHRFPRQTEGAETGVPERPPAGSWWRGVQSKSPCRAGLPGPHSQLLLRSSRQQSGRAVSAGDESLTGSRRPRPRREGPSQVSRSEWVY